MSSSKLSRRTFLSSTAASVGCLAATGEPGWSAHRSLSAQPVSANELLNIGVIGVGGRGGGDLAAVAHENIVAICDVNQQTLEKAGAAHPRAERYADYRKMLQQENLDAVVVATPDHHHAPATFRALSRGLHVYCEKPLTHTVEEARIIAKLAATQGVATQMGTQNHEHPGYLRLVELLKSQVIGPVREVHIVTDRPGRFWKQGLEQPRDTPPVPSQLNWDLWLGPAMARDYHPTYVPFAWRGWWDFGCGAIGDMAIHLMDPAFWGLNLGGRVTVRSLGPPPLAACGPTWMITRFDFQQRDELVPCTVYWYEGQAQPPRNIATELPMNGSLFVGDKGRIAIAHGGDPVLLPAEKFADFREPEPFLPKSPGHHQQWIDACKSGGSTGSHFGYAGPFTEIVLLGNVAYRTGQAIDFDPTTMKITNHEPANELLAKSYREGWSLE